MAEGKRRPIGVTLVGILYFLSGLLMLFVGAGLAVLNVSSFNGTPLQGITQMMLLLMAGVFIIVGLISLLIAFGCFKGWGWTWTLGVIFAIIGIIMAIFQAWSYGWTSDMVSSAAISVVIELVILFYLTRKGVKVWFGKA
jgi:hypothetical protein